MSSGHGDAGAGDVVSVLLVLEPDPELDLEAGERLIRQLRPSLPSSISSRLVWRGP